MGKIMEKCDGLSWKTWLTYDFLCNLVVAWKSLDTHLEARLPYSPCLSGDSSNQFHITKIEASSLAFASTSERC